MATPSYRLTYFDEQGRAELIRMIFRFNNIEFEDVRIQDEEWESLHGDPKIKFQELPILEINGKPLAQSQVIARYLAQKFGYLPTDPDATLQLVSCTHSLLRISVINNSLGHILMILKPKKNTEVIFGKINFPQDLVSLKKTLKATQVDF